MISADNFNRYNNQQGKDILGAKAFNLFLMKSQGINVPALICITPDELLKGVADIPKEEIRGVLTKNIANVSIDIMPRLKDFIKYSVRSSASAEDGDEISFAGQFDTYLYIKKNDIPTYIEKCVESLHSDSVISYCEENSIDSRNFKMSVIVQEMVDPDYSGIMFTANPQGVLSESVIVVGAGVGKNVVEDLVDTTTYYYNNIDKNYYYETMNDSIVLKDELINELIDIASKIKDIVGKYTDIEFAIKNNKIYVLQARAITTIDDSNPLIMDNSNIVESYPGISLPLTDSFVNVVYSGVFKGLAKHCIKSDKVIENYKSTFRQMVGSVNGRMYYKISNWYTIIKFLPFNRYIIPVWQDMLGVSNKNYDSTKVKIGPINRVRSYFNISHEMLSIGKSMDKLELDFKEVSKYYKENFRESLSNEQLLKLYTEIRSKLLSKWDVTLLNDMYAFIYTGLLKSLLKKLKISDYEKKTNEYISGITNIESMKPVKELIKLSYMAHEKRICNDSEALRDKEFSRCYENFIDLYGDRSMEELKLESKTFRTSKSLLWDKILDYGRDSNRLKQLIEDMNKEKNVDIDASLSEYHISAFNRKLLHFYSNHAMKGIKYREIQRLNRSRIFGMVRGIYITIGKNLKREEIISKWEDVFYLTQEEIVGIVEGRDLKDYKSLIFTRKKNYAAFAKLPVYSRIIFADSEFDKIHSNINNSYVEYEAVNMQGTPCSNGLVEGEVVVINGPSNMKNVKDKIVVTKMTDPGWVFLLVQAKGIITEKGSLLSHTAIISRELSIPAVVGVKDIVLKLKDGDRVSMDGSTGVINLI